MSTMLLDLHRGSNLKTKKVYLQMSDQYQEKYLFNKIVIYKLFFELKDFYDTAIIDFKLSVCYTLTFGLIRKYSVSLSYSLF